MKDLLVIDLRTTCFAKKEEPPGFIPEIIRIQAVVLDTKKMRMLDQFHRYVRPQLFPVLSSFCTQFTQVTQTDVDEGVPFAQACDELKQFIQPYDVIPSFWGYYGQLQFLRQCQKMKIPYPLPKKFITLKHNYSKFYQFAKPKKLKNVLVYHGLDLSTDPEDPVRDARNIAKIAAIMLQDGWDHRYLKAKATGSE